MFNNSDFSIEVKNCLEKILLSEENFKNYKVFYKIKDDDNKCPSDYIIFTHDINSSLINGCKDYSREVLIKIIVVTSFRSKNNNLKIIDLFLKKLKEEYFIKDFWVVDSIISEACTNLITNLNIRIIL